MFIPGVGYLYQMGIAAWWPWQIQEWGGLYMGTAESSTYVYPQSITYLSNTRVHRLVQATSIAVLFLTESLPDASSLARPPPLVHYPPPFGAEKRHCTKGSN
jgi:hypothetical protein